MSTISLPLLSQARIASPCPVKWADMVGDDRTRHCARCDLDVYNLSAMTSAEAEAFLAARMGSGRICAHLVRRADGTIMTRDCPVGVAAWRRRVGWVAGRVAAAVLFLATGGFFTSSEQRAGISRRLRETQPFRSVCEWLNPTSPKIAPTPRGSAPMVEYDGGLSFVSASRSPVRADGTPYVSPSSPFGDHPDAHEKAAP